MFIISLHLEEKGVRSTSQIWSLSYLIHPSGWTTLVVALTFCSLMVLWSGALLGSFGQGRSYDYQGSRLLEN